MSNSPIENVVSSLKTQLNKLNSMKEELIDLTIQITEVVAPPFEETKRGKLIQERFEEIGYNTMRDGIGNILAGKNLHIPNPIIVSAHLDTVFNNKTITVKRNGDKLFAPGVGDDSRGLTNLLVIAELLLNTKYSDNILFVATVGEEGKGDLRGVKYLFSSEEYSFSPKAFVTIDGSGTERIVDQGIGSTRYRVHFQGPGGHSWGSYGTVNPTFALSQFLFKCSNIELDTNPKTTFSAGVIGGGTSINSIPEEVWVDIDMRSEASQNLKKLDKKIKKIADQAVENENKARKGTVSKEFELVGDRPAGKLDKESWLRASIKKVHEYLDLNINWGASSTDANIPLNLNIPAIALASVENAGRAHSQDEWIDASESSILPIKRNLLLVALISQ